MKDILVLYHKHCTDGFGAAWAAWRKLGDGADYLPVVHNELPPEAATGKEIYLVDFCYDESATKSLIARNRRVTALDHHAMREPAVRLTENGVFDNERSGAAISWEYFHPGQPVPAILRYAEDADLWRWALPHTKEIAAYMDSIKQKFLAWNALSAELESDFAGCAAKGKLLLENEDRLLGEIIEGNAEEVLFEGHRVLAVNSPCFKSEIGHRLATKQPPFGIIWDRKKGKIAVSLRADSSFDVAALAAKYGGGGHTAAAGFTITGDTPVPWKTIS